MNSGLKVGDKTELTWNVSSEHVIHLGQNQLGFGLTGIPACKSVVVFSTPNMILLMERAARKVIDPYLELGEESVGARLHVEHIAATPIGAQVTAVAQVTSMDGRAIDFDVTAFDEYEMIGRGSHRRMIVNLDRIAERVSQKSSEKNVGVLLPMNVTPNRESLGPLKTLLVAADGNVAHVRLNRPEKRNAVNMQMTADLEKLTAWLAGHPEIRVVIISGAGDSFCAGDDVVEVGTLSIETARELSFRQARLYLSWENLPQILVAAIDGNALGAGCVLACACDFRIASHRAAFGMPEILLGWPPGYGIAQLTALVGKSIAMQMCLTGDRISAQKALALNLVYEVVSAQQLTTSAHILAKKLVSMPTMALRETKRLVHHDEGFQPKAAYLADTQAYIECLKTDDAKEGIQAFQEKRRPQFKAT